VVGRQKLARLRWHELHWQPAVSPTRIITSSRSLGIVDDFRFARGLEDHIRRRGLFSLLCRRRFSTGQIARLVNRSVVEPLVHDAELVVRLTFRNHPFTGQIGILAYMREFRFSYGAVRHKVEPDVGGFFRSPLTLGELRAAQRARLHREGLLLASIVFGADFARHGFVAVLPGCGIRCEESDVVDVVGVGSVDESVHKGTHAHGARSGSLRRHVAGLLC
jgi:hypothetical protein